MKENFLGRLLDMSDKNGFRKLRNMHADDSGYLDVVSDLI